MIHLPASVRVYLATSPCDMRRSFDGLHALVNAVMQLEIETGSITSSSGRTFALRSIAMLSRPRDPPESSACFILRASLNFVRSVFVT